MSRFSRLSRVSAHKLYRQHIRRAWLCFWLSWLILGVGMALLAVRVLRYEVESCGFSGYFVENWPETPSESSESPPVPLPDTAVEWDISPPVQEIVTVQPAESEMVEVDTAALPSYLPLLELAEWEAEDSPPRMPAAAPRPVVKNAPRPAPPTASAAKAAPAAVSAAPQQEGAYTPPSYRSAPKPPYPAALRQSRVQGSVKLRVFLDSRGDPLRVEVAESSGHAEFDSTAQRWVQQHWRFTPARRGDQPVPSTITTRVQFILR